MRAWHESEAGSGDVMHSAENWAAGRYPVELNYSAAQSEHSLAAVHEHLDRTRASLWIHHDLEHFRNARDAPRDYD